MYPSHPLVTQKIIEEIQITARIRGEQARISDLALAGKKPIPGLRARWIAMEWTIVEFLKTVMHKTGKGHPRHV
jgi:hypothetical protein